MFKKVGSLLFFITFSLFVFAQQSNIKFDRINYKDGLSQSDVTSIIQDYRGLIWMGTQDGLNLFNGFEFTVFSHDLSDSTSISNNFVHVLFEDSDSNLWIGTENGLNLFNRAKQNFRHFLKGTTSKNTKKLNVWSITEDENKNVWVGTDSKLFKLTKNTTTPSNYSISKINLPLSTKINELLIRKLLFINADELLIATESNGLFLYNPTTKVLEQFTTENSKLKSNIIWDIHKDSQGFIGIATNNGINILNTQTKTIISVKDLDD
ncbi:MAG: hypothetical protein CVT95_06905, partial [Bacteroidetes bacterium HGW-Bacteroidetes-12]